MPSKKEEGEGQESNQGHWSGTTTTAAASELGAGPTAPTHYFHGMLSRRSGLRRANVLSLSLSRRRLEINI